MQQSYTEAARLYKLAADQGDANAQYGLELYETGRGVGQSVAEAINWYRLAARQGDQPAKEALRRLGES